MKPTRLSAAIVAAALTMVPAMPAAAQATMSPLTCDRVDGQLNCGVQQTLSFQRNERLTQLRERLGLSRTGISIHQDGKRLKIGVSQNGSGDVAFVRQQGSDHSGTIRQDGKDDIAGLIQLWSGQTSDIVQSGDGRRTLVVQSGFRIR